jgi:8-oxo-dGTP diphosphatase
MRTTMIVNVEIVVERRGRFLLIERSADEDFGAGWLTLPGGKLEPEAVEQGALELTAQRELKEEVDLDVLPGDLEYVESHVFRIGDQPVLDVVMATHNAIGTARAVDASEVASVVWLTRAEIEAHPDVPAWTRASIALAIT